MKISKENNKATKDYTMFINTGLVAQPTIKSVGADGKSIEVPNANVEDSLNETAILSAIFPKNLFVIPGIEFCS